MSSILPRISKKARLEYFKFGVYVSVPIGVVYFFNNPPMLERIIKTHRYIYYPGEQPASAAATPRPADALAETDENVARMHAAVGAVQKRGPEAASATVQRLLAKQRAAAERNAVDEGVAATEPESRSGFGRLSALGVAAAALGLAGAALAGRSRG
jgi:hypothetical protein